MKRALILAGLAILILGLSRLASTHDMAAQDMAAMDVRGMDMGGVDSGSAADGRSAADGLMGPMADDEMSSHDGTAASGMASNSVASMTPHMAWSHPRPANNGDEQRARVLVETLRASIEKYRDYRVAERDGYKPFLPNLKLNEYHFTNYWYGFKAAFEFDPAAPTSLLYRPLPGGGYELIGAMYTAPREMGEDKLDQRVPLSVARWHRHVNICMPQSGETTLADWREFGPRGSIATKDRCDAAGGRFYPQIFGWMVHVYPWESDPTKIFAPQMN
jgi:hypothetical protein